MVSAFDIDSRHHNGPSESEVMAVAEKLKEWGLGETLNCFLHEAGHTLKSSQSPTDDAPHELEPLSEAADSSDDADPPQEQKDLTSDPTSEEEDDVVRGEGQPAAEEWGTNSLSSVLSSVEELLTPSDLVALEATEGDQIINLDTAAFAENGVLDVDNELIPEAVSVCFCKPHDTVSLVAQDFLKGCNIVSVNLMGLRHVEELPSGVLAQCDILTNVDLSALVNVTSIQNDFLQSCNSLISVDLSGLRNVARIGDNFMAGCKSLVSIRNQFERLQSIGDGFAHECHSLSTIDLEHIQGLDTVGHSFMKGCSSVDCVDLSSFEGVTHIGNYFLRECSSLQQVANVVSLQNVRIVGELFMFGCDALTKDSVIGYEQLGYRMKGKIQMAIS